MTGARSLVSLVGSAMSLTLAPLAAQIPTDAGIARFTTGNSARGIPFEFYGSLILLRASVNGSAPLTFILDTGASVTIVDTSRAQALGLRLGPKDRVSAGIGDPPVALPILDLLSIGLPGVVFPGHLAYAVPMTPAQQCASRAAVAAVAADAADAADAAAAPRRIDGILGRNFFASAVVEIDFDAKTIDLRAPADYRYGGTGTVLPLEMSSSYIFTRGMLEAPGRSPVAARLLIDTGSEIDLSVLESFAIAHDLEPPRETLTPSAECGIGGPSSATNHVGTLAALQLGGVIIRNPTTVFTKRASAHRSMTPCSAIRCCADSRSFSITLIDV